MRLWNVQTFLDGILDLETERSWYMTTELAVQNRLELT